MGGKSPWVFSSRCNVCFCVTVWSIFLRSLDDSDSHDDRDGQSNTSKFLVRCKRAFYSVPTRPSDRLGGYKSGSPESTSTLRRVFFVRKETFYLCTFPTRVFVEGIQAGFRFLFSGSGRVWCVFFQSAASLGVFFCFFTSKRGRGREKIDVSQKAVHTR